MFDTNQMKSNKKKEVVMAGAAIVFIVELVLKGGLSLAQGLVLIAREEQKIAKQNAAKKYCARNHENVNMNDLASVCNWNSTSFPTKFCEPSPEVLESLRSQMSPEACRDVRKFHDALFLYPYQDSKNPFSLSKKEEKQFYDKLTKKRELWKKTGASPDDSSKLLSAIQANAIMRNRMEKVFPLRAGGRNFYFVTPFKNKKEVNVYESAF